MRIPQGQQERLRGRIWATISRSLRDFGQSRGILSASPVTGAGIASLAGLLELASADEAEAVSKNQDLVISDRNCLQIHGAVQESLNNRFLVYILGYGTG